MGPFQNLEGMMSIARRPGLRHDIGVMSIPSPESVRESPACPGTGRPTRRPGPPTSSLPLFVILLGLAPAIQGAAPWPPITESEKSISADPGGSRPAVIIFEEGSADDRSPGGR